MTLSGSVMRRSAIACALFVLGNVAAISPAAAQADATRLQVLAPYLREQGRYIAANPPKADTSDEAVQGNAAFAAKVAADPGDLGKAGFLRIQGGENPRDGSGVHPEVYPVVDRILEATKSDRALIGNRAMLKALSVSTFTDARFGTPTVRDVVAELEKPGRDPRPAFTAALFQNGIEKITDLHPGLQLQGVVTNVAAFGAFVDIGVHQDGLVHISAMARKRISSPSEVVKVGDVVRVLVLAVDVPRKRISLSLRLDDPIDRPAASSARTTATRPDPQPETATAAFGAPAGGGERWPKRCGGPRQDPPADFSGVRMSSRWQSRCPSGPQRI